MDQDERERLKDIVNDLNAGMKMPPYNTGSKRGYSREYKEYKEEEKEENQMSRYEKLCNKSSEILNIKAGKRSQKKLSPPLRLLKWDITPGMVLSASVMVSFGLFMLWSLAFMVNMVLGPFIPVSIMMVAGVISAASGAYVYYKPVYAAKNKVIKSSGEMILSILYMVIYMRSSPNLEGAIRFAALNLEGPISKDLKGILWDVEVGKYNSIEESLEKYTKAWKDYNDDFLESLQLLKAAVNEPNKERRESLLQDSIDRILDGTQEKMKHYAQGLKTPVMILNAMGAMLPVLGMIMLPLISVFMGSSITITHLFLLFNVMLPGFLYWFMQRVLSSRPPTVSSKPTSEESLPTRGKYLIESLDIEIPTWPIGLGIFFVIGLYGMVGYLIFPYTYPVGAEVLEQTSIPALLGGSDGVSPLAMLMRSLSLTTGAGLGIGTALILGNKKRKKAEENLKNIEQQFPTALFQLGNKISGGTPIELALEEAAESTSDLEISALFRESSHNIKDMGMTFEKAIFDESYGALRQFPSQMIHTVMKAILKSSDKGTNMASMAMMTISKYLDNIHKTQERLNDLMEDTTTTILMLAYLLAPIVSGIAVGMSQTIITAMYELSRSFSDIEGEIGSTQAGAGGDFTGILGNLDSAIPPEVLQFVVGVYLIQLLFILGTFYMKIQEGENKTYRNMFIGKILISGMIFYSLSLIIVSVLFGGIVQGVPT
ncbi:MAG: Flp pilus assembly protein TadB [Candidatus Nanohaloarchaea archaeon]|jgi:Flp pilus assembly protein TadB